MISMPWGVVNMDKYTVAEEAYKNGYAKGYADAMATLNPGRPDTSRRGAKLTVLMEEARYHDDILKVIADELSWRVVMRVVHKLRRKRGVEQ